MSDTTITISQMVAGLADGCRSLNYFKQVQTVDGRDHLDAMAESIAEVPLCQVYLDRFEPQNTGTDRNTFGGARGTVPKYVEKSTYFIDVYAAQRANIGQDLWLVYEATDRINDLMRSQTHKPYFQLNVQAFRYRAERLTFEYGTVKYAGIRFIVEFTTM